jgi:hypothetical protein
MLSTLVKTSPARSPLVSFFQARFEYLSCVHKGPKDELPEKLKVESKQGILKQLAFARTISMQDAIDLTNMLDESKLPEDAATDIRQAIQLKADIQGDAAPASSEKVRQTHGHLEHYQAASDWVCYASAATHEIKMLHMARRMHSLYLYNPTEPTISGAVAVALYADGPHDPSYLLAKVRLMKEFLSTMSKELNRIPPDLPKNFPAEVQTFKETHSVLFEIAFAEGLPAACPIASVMMNILKAGAPCRRTRSGCNESTPQTLKQNGRSQAIVNSVFQRQHSDVQLPGFRWCQGSNSFQPPPYHPGAIAAGPAIPGYLAIGDLPPSFVQPPLTPAVETSSPAVTPPKEANPLAIAAVEGTPPASAIEKGVTKVSELVAKFQARAAASKVAAVEPDETDEADEDQKTSGDAKAIALKRPAAAKKAEPAAKKAKSEGTAKKAKLEAAAKKAQPEATDKQSQNEFQKLVYKAGAHLPRYYGSVTVYTDTKNEVWRVKPCPGSRSEKKNNWRADGGDNRKQWETLVGYVKSLPQV